MSTAPADNPVPVLPDATPVSITTAKKARSTPIMLDGHALTAYRPKSAWMVEAETARGRLDPDDPGQIEFLYDLVRKVFRDQPDQDHLFARMHDDDDEFDVEDLDAVFRVLQEKWSGGRPTGPSGASSRRPGKTGGRSTARRR